MLVSFLHPHRGLASSTKRSMQGSFRRHPSKDLVFLRRLAKRGSSGSERLESYLPATRASSKRAFSDQRWG